MPLISLAGKYIRTESVDAVETAAHGTMSKVYIRGGTVLLVGESPSTIARAIMNEEEKDV